MRNIQDDASCVRESMSVTEIKETIATRQILANNKEEKPLHNAA